MKDIGSAKCLLIRVVSYRERSERGVCYPLQVVWAAQVAAGAVVAMHWLDWPVSTQLLEAHVEPHMPSPVCVLVTLKTQEFPGRLVQLQTQYFCMQNEKWKAGGGETFRNKHRTRGAGQTIKTAAAL